MTAADRRDVALAAVVFAVTVAYCAVLPRNLNPADEAVYLYEAKRLLAGQVPYRDFFEITTPGWMLLMAALFRVFGTDLGTARAAAAVIHGAAAAAIVLLCRQLGVRRALSWPAAAAYLVVCVPAWPIASQHWLTTLLMLVVVLVCARRARGWSFLAGLFLGLIVAVQQQRGVILTLGTAAWLVFERLLPGGRRGTLRADVAALAAGVVAIVGPMLVALVATAGFGNVWRALVVHPLLNYGGTTHCAWGHVNVMTALQGTFTFPRVLACLPVVLVPVLVRLVRRRRRGDGLLLVATAAAVASIAYFPDFIHIAFIAPLFFVAAGVGLEMAAGALPRSRAAKGLAFAAGVVLLVGAGVRLGDVLVRSRRLYPITHETAFGRIAFASEADVRFYETLDRRLEDVRPRELFCYPGVSYLYLVADADNPTRFGFFHAGYASPDQVQEVLDTVEAKRLPYVAVIRAFAGIDDTVMAYLRRAYDPLAPDDGAMFQLYRRKGWAPTS